VFLEQEWKKAEIVFDLELPVLRNHRKMGTQQTTLLEEV